MDSVPPPCPACQGAPVRVLGDGEGTVWACPVCVAPPAASAWHPLMTGLAVLLAEEMIFDDRPRSVSVDTAGVMLKAMADHAASGEEAGPAFVPMLRRVMGLGG